MTIGKLKLKQAPGTQPKAKREKKQEEMQKIFSENLKAKDKITTYDPISGTGTIVTSGTTMIGENTKFKSQIQNGDKIVIKNPLLQTSEQREVMVVLGQKSILLKQPFVEDINQMTNFVIQKQPKIEKGENIAEEYQKKVNEVKKTKQIEKETLDLRVKKGMWSYKKQQVDVGKNASRQELLDIRSKKIKDKFCW